MDSKKLEILVTAVDLGSFTKASDVVGYTQSGLTHMMDTLEREIGIPLLRRNHSGIELTEYGVKLMPAIREFLRANARLENQIQAIRETTTTTIRIAAYSSIAMHWMPEILYRFRRLCPDVRVDLRMVDHALEPFELLEEGKTDVIFASRQNYSRCEWTPLYDDFMYAILPKDYPLTDRNTFPLEEFSGKEFLMPYGRFDIDINAAMKQVGIKLNVKPSYVDDETVIRMVGRGLGVSMMTELMIRGRTDDVLCVPVSPETFRELGMGIYMGGDVTDSIQKLKDCVLQFIKDRKICRKKS
ncbi:MAG: LysR family transcriptional regulator [Lachnospiraceae bacterium]|nr:LysR family transcriptional regulator [Lachnospiraceae bacterium]